MFIRSIEQMLCFRIPAGRLEKIFVHKRHCAQARVRVRKIGTRHMRIGMMAEELRKNLLRFFQIAMCIAPMGGLDEMMVF